DPHKSALAAPHSAAFIAANLRAASNARLASDAGVSVGGGDEDRRPAPALRARRDAARLSARTQRLELGGHRFADPHLRIGCRRIARGLFALVDALRRGREGG